MCPKGVLGYTLTQHNWQQGLPSMSTEHSGGVSGAIRMQSGVGRYQRIPVA
ncbi:hypothetical protein JL_221 [Bacillus phage JL]|uniref:Uncharacterized protein n=1 Tax=Bacillus phage JL TaxID=1296655 RepID=V5TGW4_9CAUD|nr:hypothetical protein AVV47_gp075 [Bacillus phage JL]AHB63471.1 hypothetical protein JL_221 [Bacillus phage JL]